MTREELEVIEIRARALQRCLQGMAQAETMEERIDWAIRALVGKPDYAEDLFTLIEEVRRLRGWTDS